ncbi:MAG: alkaline phosphatase [Gammaproteobacteria bacterium]|nr:alkaline phosphatase [Gammaproteobacteria bacterium]
MRYIAPLVIALCAPFVVNAADMSEPARAWYESGKASLEERKAQFRGSKKRARNAILFIGDGMSVPTVTAARIYEGQLRGEDGEGNLLSFEAFPASALSKTYAVDKQVTDSGSTATAMVTGVKTRFRQISMDETAGEGCDEGKLRTLVELAEEAGLATGVVSTTRVTHATPATLYSHVIERNYEMEGKQGCQDIASQLIDFPYGDGLEVALGGGAPMFSAEARDDGRDLAAEWQARFDNAVVIRDAGQLAALDKEAQHVLGLFSESHMDYELHRDTTANGQPSLTEMTEAAINLVNNNRKGFFLMIEGGRIDHGHHAGNAKLALTETIEFSNAIRRAREMTEPDTLIVVTADHGHTMSMSGYPDRGNPVLGIAGEDSEGRPYTTLGYANGPGYVEPDSLDALRPDLSKIDTTADDYQQEATVPAAMETHGGDDVPVYAVGPGSQWVNGVDGTARHLPHHQRGVVGALVQVATGTSRG